MLTALCVAAVGCNGGRGTRDASSDAADARSDAAAEGGGTDLRRDMTAETAGDAAADVAPDVSADVTPDVAADVAADVGADATADVVTTDATSDGAAADGATDGPPGPIVTVSSFGCFARSGDGDDYFPDGTRAVVVTNSPWRAPCGVSWIGLNENGYTKPTTPSTESLTRQFVIDSLISDRATITVSFEADDAAEIVLNGKLIASCTPPAGNVGECQQSCRVVTLSKDDLEPVGQVNLLEMRMVNLLNTSVPGGNTGYTGISYAICAQGE